MPRFARFAIRSAPPGAGRMFGRISAHVRSLANLAPLLAAVTFAAGTHMALAQQFGVSVGVNFDQLSDIEIDDREATFESKNGWHVEIWVETPPAPLTFRLGARYKEAGMLFDGLNDHTSTVRDNFDVTLLEIPLLVRYAIGPRMMQPTIFIGPVGRMTAISNVEFLSHITTPSIGGEAGIGLQFAVGRLRLIPEIAFTWGLTNFLDDQLVIGSIMLIPSESQSLNSAMLRLAIGF